MYIFRINHICIRNHLYQLSLFRQSLWALSLMLVVVFSTIEWGIEQGSFIIMCDHWDGEVGFKTGG